MLTDGSINAVATAELSAGRIVRRNSLKDLAYQEIKGLLVGGRLVPDRLYSAQHFAQLLGVSRTPVREALLRLANEGLLVCREVKGFQIKEFSRKEIQDVLETRALIETHVVKCLAGRLNTADLADLEECHRRMALHAAEEDDARFIEADQDFHMSLLRRWGNRHMLAVMENIRSQLALFGLKALGRLRHFAEVIQEHASILETLRGADKKQAVLAMRRHLDATTERMCGNETAHASVQNEPASQHIPPAELT